jgi:polar amino acid transport system substrate-binding protein
VSASSTFKPNRRDALIGAAGLAAATAFAVRPALADTVSDIKSKGTIVIGIQGDNAPWGFVNAQGKQDGIDKDVGDLFARFLGVKAEYKPLAVADRIPALTTGRVDVLFATMAMLPERAKVVQYSRPYAANTIVLYGAKADSIKTNEDMARFTIGAPSSSAQDQQVTKLAPKGTRILRFADDSATIQALISGQVQAIGGNSAYLARLEQAKPGVFERKLTFVSLYNGACARLGDKPMNEALNAFLDKTIPTDEFKAIYKKWFAVDVPAFPASIEGVPFNVT